MQGRMVGQSTAGHKEWASLDQNDWDMVGHGETQWNLLHPSVIDGWLSEPQRGAPPQASAVWQHKHHPPCGTPPRAIEGAVSILHLPGGRRASSSAWPSLVSIVGLSEDTAASHSFCLDHAILLSLLWGTDVPCEYIHPGKLTWNLKMDLWKTIFLYNPVVFRFHVKFPVCSIQEKRWKEYSLVSLVAWIFSMPFPCKTAAEQKMDPPSHQEWTRGRLLVTVPGTWHPRLAHTHRCAQKKKTIRAQVQYIHRSRLVGTWAPRRTRLSPRRTVPVRRSIWRAKLNEVPHLGPWPLNEVHAWVTAGWTLEVSEVHHWLQQSMKKWWTHLYVNADPRIPLVSNKSMPLAKGCICQATTVQSTMTRRSSTKGRL